MEIYFSYFLLICYLLGLTFLVKRISFFKSIYLSKNTILFLAVLKMIIAMLYVYLTVHHIKGGDIVHYFKNGNLIYEQLYTNPWSYFKLTFLPNNVNNEYGVESVIHEMSFWRDTGAYMLVRFNALIRPFSLGNIYVHSVFAGFLSFVGSFFLLKVFEAQFVTNKIVVLSIFLSPSLLFWTAGVHKEFVSTLALGLILYHFFSFFKPSNKFKNSIFFLVGILLFFFTRNYMLLALVPSLLAYTLHKQFHYRFILTMLFSLIVLKGFLSFQEIPTYNKTGFEVIIDKRGQFEALKNGNTAIELDPIKPNFNNLLKNSPKALFNSLARPHLGDVKSFFLALACIESLLISLLFLFALFNLYKLPISERNVAIFMLLYSVFLLLIIGWIVPNIGAILRYRSIALIILIPTLLQVCFQNESLKKWFERKN